MANAINSLNYNSNIYVFTTPYGSCSTAAGTAAKTVSVDNFSLETGARVAVKFTVTNTAASPTLNVNSTGAKAIYYNGAAITAGYLKANKVYEFIYNGTQWDFIGDIDTDTNTKNTAGSTDTSSKIFLVGATSQAANPQTYSHDTAYVGTDGCLYSGGSKVAIDSAKLDKLTYEWNKQYNAGGTAGYLLIGSFPMYDTNITIDIDSTTSTTYHGTVIIATQNVSETSIGSSRTVTVYGDPTGAISDAIRVVWTSGSRNYNVYFAPSTWSKNLIHIRAIGNYLENIDESKICTQFTNGTAPATTSGITVTNALKSNFNNFTYTHPSHTAVTGVPTANQTPAFGGTFTVNQITNNNLGHVTANTSRTITIPSTAASASAAGLVNTGAQTFAGAKTFNTQIVASDGIKTGGHIVSDTASTDWVGTIATPFAAMYTDAMYIHPMGDNNAYAAGHFKVNVAGTTSAQGSATLAIGNQYKTGQAFNTRGYLRIYGTGTGYTELYATQTDGTQVNVAIPKSAGTLALTSDISLSTLGITATAAELNYCDGVTSNIQTQIGNCMPKSGGTFTGAVTFNSTISVVDSELETLVSQLGSI